MGSATEREALSKGSSPKQEYPVLVTAGKVTLEGDLCLPEKAQGIVAFAHGSGSSRRSPRNRYVASILQNSGIATLLFDLLTAREEDEDMRTGRLRFDIDLLSLRLVGATDWLTGNPELRHLPIGYFGASTGTAAALKAAVERPEAVVAVVSRGGRPDLAEEALPKVKAPTLLIVGGLDFTVIQLNRAALARLNVEKEMVIVPGATHLFEEPGTLEEVARIAARWFNSHLFRPASKLSQSK